MQGARALSAISSARLGLKTCLIEKGTELVEFLQNTLMGSFSNDDDEGNVYATIS